MVPLRSTLKTIDFTFIRRAFKDVLKQRADFAWHSVPFSLFVDTIRFLNQFWIGRGDYEKEHEQWLGDISVGNVISQMKAGKKTNRIK